MKIERVELHQISLPLVQPFAISVASITHNKVILVSAHADGLTGWGECVVSIGPYYSYETDGTAWHILGDYLIPALLGQELATPQEAAARMKHVRGHPMAKAALENAIWDLFAQAQGVPLSQLLGGARARVAVGVSIGIHDSIAALIATVERHVDEGYRRVKLKIKPGWDVEPVRAVREKWPELALQVDANTAYTLTDAPTLQTLDQFDLLLIEQPLHHDDIVEHAQLQRQLATPICLDESIHSPEHARWALALQACGNINIKVGRVGGFTAAKEIHDLCAVQGIPVWCGGMLETNVGRAGNVALASLPNFTLPGDISASKRYYRQDIAQPDFDIDAESAVPVPKDAGLGVQIMPQRLANARSRREIFR